MLLTKSNTIIIGQVATLLGLLMNAIFSFTDGVFGISNIGVCIILFTLVIYALLTPLTIKQQKFSKMSAIMNPEIKAIQKKYAGKNDQVSMMKMNENTECICKIRCFSDGNMSSDADSAADPVCIVSCNLEYSGLRCKCKRCIYSSCKCSFKDTGYTAVFS